MYKVRSLRASDIDLVCSHRERMFREAGWSGEVLTAMAAPFRRWLVPRVQDGRYIGWVAEENVTAIAGLGMMIIEWSPHPSHPTQDRRGYILNLFVEPAHRRVGLARRLMAMAIDDAERQGIGFMVLHATEVGRPLYEKLGWRPTTEMAISLTWAVAHREVVRRWRDQVPSYGQQLYQRRNECRLRDPPNWWANPKRRRDRETTELGGLLPLPQLSFDLGNAGVKVPATARSK
jgi:GNAT superfamily N-acetyltransferase